MLTDAYVLRLHKQMYGEVWIWAGRYRRHDTNIGSPHHSVRPDLRLFFEDARDWFERGWFAPEEYAVRAQHRLVKVHPFANGNGRHARLFADVVLIRHFRRDRLPWGGGKLGSSDPSRSKYIAALQDDLEIRARHDQVRPSIRSTTAAEASRSTPGMSPPPAWHSGKITWRRLIRSKGRRNTRHKPCSISEARVTPRLAASCRARSSNARSILMVVRMWQASEWIAGMSTSRPAESDGSMPALWRNAPNR